jgi:hypothetical protein
VVLYRDEQAGLLEGVDEARVQSRRLHVLAHHRLQVFRVRHIGLEAVIRPAPAVPGDERLELNSHTAEYAKLKWGQHKSHQGLLALHPAKVVSACARHAMPEQGGQINTSTDILEIQVMCGKDGERKYSTIYLEPLWEHFICRWYKTATPDKPPSASAI